ncbi:Ankyrin repeat domain-containing protein [Tetrabaena socialis]|uniref:Ankyrin repeat domain-containing protein n=1 Tax=Tetrabaena socialis TaxID=47790 RepID=A0A2J8AI22_9CHLO|nr:Ankyrin repeat domain-containing protein [Tetrabaena socialis]|eukprot:PNH12168.1 Ankyrin repeat domain-containing protein [Tetrabaena socialis]
MIGRGAYNDPWGCLADADRSVYGDAANAAPSRRWVIQRYLEYAEPMLGRWCVKADGHADPSVRTLMRPLLNLFHGEAGSKRWKAEVDAVLKAGKLASAMEHEQQGGKRHRSLPQAEAPGEPLLLPPKRQIGGASAAAPDPSRVWLPDLVQRFAGFLTCNEVACVLRLVNKAAAAQFSRPEDRTVRLSLPVPHREFARRWGGRDVVRSLTPKQRRLLPCLTARSGSIANLKVLLARGEAGHVLETAVLGAATAAGHIGVRSWLRLQGCTWSIELHPAREAARCGHTAMCEWLVVNRCAQSRELTCEAARGGHVGLMDLLLRSASGCSPDTITSLLEGAASGCDLPTLQRLLHTYLDSDHVDRHSAEQKAAVLAAAAASPTPDWRAKVECLEDRGYPRTGADCSAAASLPDWRARLGWLRQRGYLLTSAALVEAAGGGHVEALQYLLAEGVEMDAGTANRAALHAAKAGHVAVLQALAGAPTFRAAALVDALAAAAEQGHLRVVAWLADVLGGRALTVRVFVSAVRSGSLELLAWLRAHGCPWDATVFAEAAGLGSEEQVEWLAARGCPMGEEGEPYLSALRHQGLVLPPLQCLQRLGCPWGPTGAVFLCALERCQRLDAASSCRAALRALTWLLVQGCPVEPGAAVQLAEAQLGRFHHARMEELLLWLVGGASAVAPDPSPDPSRVWLPDLVPRFASFLTCNEVACILRLVNKAAAAQFSRPEDRTVRLSLPVPHREFARRWGGRDAVRSLTLARRRLLPCLTARSGSIANLKVLLARGEAGHVLESAVLDAATAAGHIKVVAWLRSQGCAWSADSHAAREAARCGHTAMCEWLVANSLAQSCELACGAAHGGHVGLMDLLLRSAPGCSPDTITSLLEAAAAGCDLPTLQRLLHAYLDSDHVDRHSAEQKAAVLAAAAASLTEDWRAKVECLEDRGYPRTGADCSAAASLPDWRARLGWLRQRGYRLTSAALVEAAGGGHVDALQYLVAEGVEMDADTIKRAALHAAKAGHVAVLQVLVGGPTFRAAALVGALAAAAEEGHLPVVAWLADVLGCRARTVRMFEPAVRSGSMELLAWLHARRYEWHERVFAEAAGLGSEEQVEWLAARGCPMGKDGEPYLSALRHQGLVLPPLQCLQRLGCPWGPTGAVLLRALERSQPLGAAFSGRTALRALTWLLVQGCPVELGAAVQLAEAQLGKALEPAERAWMEELLPWLVEQQHRRD